MSESIESASYATIEADKTPNQSKSVRRSQASRRAETEQRLLQAALEIVAERGSERMTLADVGLAAGCSRGLAAHHFGNKNGLLRGLAAHLEDRYEARRLAYPKRTPGLDAVRGAIRLYFNNESSIETKALLTMMSEALLEGAAVKDEIVQYNMKVLKGLEHHIKIGLQNGEIRPGIDPSAAAALIMGALRGTMLQSLLHNGIDLQKICNMVLDFVDGVLANH